MQYSIPDYYKEFHCIADQCEETCCAGWQIMIDKKSLKKYIHTKSPYRWTLLRGIDFLHGAFRQKEEKRCFFLNENNARIIQDTLKNLRMYARSRCPFPVRRQQGFCCPKQNRFTSSPMRSQARKNTITSIHFSTPCC